MKSKIKKLEDGETKLEELKGLLGKSDKDNISPTNTDNALMKSRDGKMAYYNIQTGKYANYHMLLVVQAITYETDMEFSKTCELCNISQKLCNT